MENILIIGEKDIRLTKIFNILKKVNYGYKISSLDDIRKEKCDMLIIIDNANLINKYKKIELLVLENKFPVVYIRDNITNIHNIHKDCRYYVMNSKFMEYELLPIINLLRKTYKIMNSMNHKYEKLKEEFQTFETITDAKNLLVNKYKITENEAHKFIIDKSMEKRLSKLEVAKKIVKN